MWGQDTTEDIIVLYLMLVVVGFIYFMLRLYLISLLLVIRLFMFQANSKQEWTTIEHIEE